MKLSRNIPAYLLSGALVFVGVTSVSQADGATSATKQIQSLQKKIKTLESDLDDLAESIGIANTKISTLERDVITLTYKPASSASDTLKSSTIRFIALQGFLTTCPGDSYPAELFSPSFTAGGKTLVECRITVLTK